MGSLRKAVASLYVVQLATYVIPLFTLPWLTRVLEPSGFGTLSFCIAVNTYFTLFADFGFNFTATREIAVNQDNLARRSEIFWTTILAKALLAVIGLSMLCAGCFWVERFAAQRHLLLIGYAAVLGSVLTPIWYFQGTERLPFLSTVTVIIRTLSVPLTFLMVRNAADIDIALAINAGVPCVTGVICLLAVARRKEIRPVNVSAQSVIHALRASSHLFLSNAAISLYTTSNTVLLGLVSSGASVGYYSAAERLIKAAQGLVNPISQSFYPRIARLMQQSRPEALALVRRLLRIQGGAGLAISVGIFVLAPEATHLLYGDAFGPTTSVLRWLSPLPFAIALSNVFGIQTMLPLGMNKEFSRVIILVGAANVAALGVLGSVFGATGAAMAVLGAEVCVTLLMAGILHRRGIHLFKDTGIRTAQNTARDENQ